MTICFAVAVAFAKRHLCPPPCCCPFVSSSCVVMTTDNAAVICVPGFCCHDSIYARKYNKDAIVVVVASLAAAVQVLWLYCLSFLLLLLAKQM